MRDGQDVGDRVGSHNVQQTTRCQEGNTINIVPAILLKVGAKPLPHGNHTRTHTHTRTGCCQAILLNNKSSVHLISSQRKEPQGDGQVLVCVFSCCFAFLHPRLVSVRREPSASPPPRLLVAGALVYEVYSNDNPLSSFLPSRQRLAARRN